MRQKQNVLQQAGDGTPSTHDAEEGSEKLDMLTAAKLRERCEQHGLEKTGKKADLLDRLRQALYVRMQFSFRRVCATSMRVCTA